MFPVALLVLSWFGGTVWSAQSKKEKNPSNGMGLMSS